MQDNNTDNPLGSVRGSWSEPAGPAIGEELRLLREQRNRAEAQLVTLATASEAAALTLAAVMKHFETDPASITIDLQPPQGPTVTMHVGEIIAWVNMAIAGARGGQL